MIIEAVVALAVIVGGFVAVAPDDDDPPRDDHSRIHICVGHCSVNNPIEDEPCEDDDDE